MTSGLRHLLAQPVAVEEDRLPEGGDVGVAVGERDLVDRAARGELERDAGTACERLDEQRRLEVVGLERGADVRDMPTLAAGVAERTVHGPPTAQFFPANVHRATLVQRFAVMATSRVLLRQVVPLPQSGSFSSPPESPH